MNLAVLDDCMKLAHIDFTMAALAANGVKRELQTMSPSVPLRPSNKLPTIHSLIIAWPKWAVPQESPSRVKGNAGLSDIIAAQRGTR